MTSLRTYTGPAGVHSGRYYDGDVYTTRATNVVRDQDRLLDSVRFEARESVISVFGVGGVDHAVSTVPNVADLNDQFRTSLRTSVRLGSLVGAIALAIFSGLMMPETAWPFVAAGAVTAASIALVGFLCGFAVPRGEAAVSAPSVVWRAPYSDVLHEDDMNKFSPLDLLASADATALSVGENLSAHVRHNVRAITTSVLGASLMVVPFVVSSLAPDLLPDGFDAALAVTGLVVAIFAAKVYKSSEKFMADNFRPIFHSQDEVARRRQEYREILDAAKG